MSELPDTTWDREYGRRTQECIDAAAEAAARPSPRMLPARVPGAGPTRGEARWLDWGQGPRAAVCQAGRAEARAGTVRPRLGRLPPAGAGNAGTRHRLSW